MIKRYHQYCNEYYSDYAPELSSEIDSDGDWVLYEDHAEEVRELEEEIAELKRQLSSYKEAVYKCRGGSICGCSILRQK